MIWAPWRKLTKNPFFYAFLYFPLCILSHCSCNWKSIERIGPSTFSSSLYLDCSIQIDHSFFVFLFFRFLFSFFLFSVFQFLFYFFPPFILIGQFILIIPFLFSFFIFFCFLFFDFSFIFFLPLS